MDADWSCCIGGNQGDEDGVIVSRWGIQSEHKNVITAKSLSSVAWATIAVDS